MTSEKSKRRDFLALAFLSELIKTLNLSEAISLPGIIWRNSFMELPANRVKSLMYVCKYVKNVKMEVVSFVIYWGPY